MSHHDEPTRKPDSAYELEPTGAPPDLPGVVIVRPTAHDVIDALAADLLVHAFNCVRAFGDFHLCVSGSGSIEPVLLRLLTDPAYRELPWKRTHLWLFAESAAPGANREYDLLHETLTIHADLPREQAHAIDTARPDAAKRYERTIRETLEWREKGHDRFDYVLLAPESAPSRWSVDDRSDALVRDYGGVIACTPRLINAARMITVVAIGEPARGSVEQVVNRDHPLTALNPIGGVLHWRLDEAACRDAE